MFIIINGKDEFLGGSSNRLALWVGEYPEAMKFSSSVQARIALKSMPVRSRVGNGPFRIIANYGLDSERLVYTYL